MVPTQALSRRRAASLAFCRYPWVEALFQHRCIQPFIHDTRVTVRFNGQDHTFLLFCQNHRHLPRNTAVAGHWRGDIVVMRVEMGGSDVVNMRPQDAPKVDEVVYKYVTICRLLTCLKIYFLGLFIMCSRSPLSASQRSFFSKCSAVFTI